MIQSQPFQLRIFPFKRNWVVSYEVVHIITNEATKWTRAVEPYSIRKTSGAYDDITETSGSVAIILKDQIWSSTIIVNSAGHPSPCTSPPFVSLKSNHSCESPGYQDHRHSWWQNGHRSRWSQILPGESSCLWQREDCQTWRHPRRDDAGSYLGSCRRQAFRTPGMTSLFWFYWILSDQPRYPYHLLSSNIHGGWRNIRRPVCTVPRFCWVRIWNLENLDWRY